jgi:hypothetical protein
MFRRSYELCFYSIFAEFGLILDVALTKLLAIET